MTQFKFDVIVFKLHNLVKHLLKEENISVKVKILVHFLLLESFIIIVIKYYTIQQHTTLINHSLN
jgi:hypothetical protein